MPRMTEGEPRGIFISYRRADSQAWTGRLANDLRQYYGRENIFLDLDSNRAAQDYIVQLRAALGRSRAVVAVLGPEWLSASRDGSARIHDPADLVRQELETALGTGIALVVVLVGGAVPPTRQQLPESLGPLATIQVSRMADEDWEYDLGRLIETLERHGVVASRSEGRPAQIAEWEPTSNRKYERVVQASRRRALDGVLGVVEALAYKERKVFAEAAQVGFRAMGRQVTVKVLDDAAGRSRLVVEYPTIRAGTAAAGTVAATVLTGGAALLPVGASWVALRAWERRFARGFLDNVERVLQGRGVGEDSAVPRGLSDWRNRNRDV
jgi:TIR domain